MFNDISCSFREALRKECSENGHLWGDRRIKASEDYLVAWDRWAKECSKSITPKWCPMWLEAIVFILAFPLVIRRSSKCTKLNNILEEKQSYYYDAVEEEIRARQLF